MTLLDTAIDRYFSATNARNNQLAAECFDPDASVFDEGQHLTGLESIQHWLQQSQRARAMQAAQSGKSSDAAPGDKKKAAASKQPERTDAAAPAKRKLSYKEQRELEALPAQIDALETEQATLRAELADTSIYQRDAQRAAALHTRDAAIEDELMQALERWEELGAVAGPTA